MQKQPRVFHLLQLAHSALFRASDAWLKQQDEIGSAQLAVLFALLRKDMQPMSAIADQLSMRYSSLSGLIDRMERKQLVTRVICEADRRVQRLQILDAGQDIAQRQITMTKRVNEALLEPFSAQERETIGRFLIHVKDNADRLFHAQNQGKSND